ncbi:AMP-binding protein [Dyella caseinilytica]|uniref:Acyl-CoA synthetase n=1 Tax=Dyella caseinilytica TaxID=1849581 RepID=A0ABX7GSV5_9GAMM|nr:AMP-binding protein [Dyella caseinilytica]QRN53516.1 acyl-CoA synthetase [Dyella caseinilytica]GFZ87032.1 AMP-ligase [Dyella caseinilytica]
MAIVYDTYQRDEAERLLPLLKVGDPQRVLAMHEGDAITAAQFVAHVERVAAQLPEASAAVNLCEDRYAFMVAFCAIALRGQANLLPPSRAPHAVEEVMAAHPGCHAVGDRPMDPSPHRYHPLPELAVDAATALCAEWPSIAAMQTVAVGYTSGSTGAPRPNTKTWRSLHASTAGNLRMLHQVVGERFAVVATVPPQHIYGIEMSVLLPLLGDVQVHSGRPFFPADIAMALAQVPGPRVLVTTPVHLRALVESGVTLPALAAMLSATAPMPPELAAQAERCFDAPVMEVFGSTETCAFASRRVTADSRWSLYHGVHLHPQPDGTQIEAPQLDVPATLADIVTLHDDGRRFELCGRHADLLEIAGKRASLGDLTRRLLAIPGVKDGAVFQLDEPDAIGVRRIAALVVAPALDEHIILDALRASIDPVFLPRPLRLVESLPRNETGKLPRAALLDLLARHVPA